MTFRTRMAFIVILFLLGCVFAAPFYQSAISISEKSAASDASPPTLQIQRTPALEDESVEAAKTHHSTPTNTNAAVPRGEDVAALAEPIPALALPPPMQVAKSAEQPLKAVPIRDSSASRAEPSVHKPGNGITMHNASGMRSGAESRSLKPVSLVGTNIGASFTRSSRGPRPTTRTTNIAWDQQQVGAADGAAHSQKLQSRRTVSPTLSSNRNTQALQRIDRPSGAKPHFSSVQPPTQTSHSTDRAKRTRSDTVSGNSNDRTGKRWHRIARFDNLKELSKKYYGTPENALLIFAANRHTLVSPAILPLGTELLIPDPAEFGPAAPTRPRQTLPHRAVPVVPLSSSFTH